MPEPPPPSPSPPEKLNPHQFVLHFTEITEGAWELALIERFYGTVCKNSAHEAKLKIEVVLSPQHHDARIQTSCVSYMLRGQNAVPETDLFRKKWGCGDRQTVAATCPRYMSP